MKTKTTLAGLFLIGSAFVSSMSAQSLAPTCEEARTIQTLTTTGRSMLPAIPSSGAKLQMWTDAGAFDTIKRGDVIVFIVQGRIIVHRAIKQVRPGVWWIKGDRNPLPDSFYVTRANFIGLVITPIELPVRWRDAK